MAQYTISDLEQLSGIKAHTIRIWEKRYKLVTPSRTCTNIRMYSDEDLKKILNVSLLNRHGFKISKIAKLPEEEIHEKILLLSQHSHSYSDYTEALIVSMIELNEERFNQLISSAIMKIGFEETFIYIVYPVLEKVGLLWQAGTINPAQEHFITNLLRQKLIVAIDGAYIHQKPGAKKFLLFLPEGEMHEIGLLFYQYLITKRGHKGLYLGSSTPLQDLPPIARHFHPDYLVTLYIKNMDKSTFDRHVQFLTKQFPEQRIFLSGRQASEYADHLPQQVQFCKTPLDFLEELKKIS